MANVNNPHGLRPLMRTDAGGRPQCEAYAVASNYGYAIYIWDPVTRLAGVLNGPASGITPGATLYLGVALNAVLASTGGTIIVMDQFDALFETQEDASGAANVVAGKMGYNANLTATAGDATRLWSKVQLSGTSIDVGTSGALDVNIRRLLNVPDNAYGANARLEIKFNRHLHGSLGLVQT